MKKICISTNTLRLLDTLDGEQVKNVLRSVWGHVEGFENTDDGLDIDEIEFYEVLIDEIEYYGKA